jgi:hypothetical protein
MDQPHMDPSDDELAEIAESSFRELDQREHVGEQAVRRHGGFINGYVPEVEELYE